MDRISLFYRVIILAATITFCTLSVAPASEQMPTGIKTGPLRFDAILELDAPGAETYVILFVRYWVSTDSYSISVVWAEPEATMLNYATRPVPIAIHSNREQFSLNHQVFDVYNSAFPKPIGDRVPFTYTNNDYNIKEIRYTDSEAVRSRVYLSDLRNPALVTDDGLRLLPLQPSNKQEHPGRIVRQARVRDGNGQPDALKLYDKSGNLLQSIKYEYTNRKGTQALSELTAILPQKSITVGSKEPVKISRNGEQPREYNSWLGAHHVGGRKCVVKFNDINVGSAPARLPVNISVYNEDRGTFLRSARMFNFVLTTESEIRLETARAYAKYDADELVLKKLIKKYWLKTTAQMSPNDVDSVKRLRQKFNPVVQGSLGRILRRIYKLMILDSMEADHVQLSVHFQEYLDVLLSNKLELMALFGGQGLIERTARWKQYATANELLTIWLSKVAVPSTPEMLRHFCGYSARMHRVWTIIQLIQVCDSIDKFGNDRFYALHLRSLALYELLRILRDESLVADFYEEAHAALATTSFSVEVLSTIFEQSISEANEEYSRISKPTEAQKRLKAELDILLDQ